jgi:uncharacterized protein YigA (DUF484 family)
MSIISLSRWDIPQNDALRIVRDTAPLMQTHGASTVTLSRVQAGGNETGQTVVIVTYKDWESYGRAMQAQNSDQVFQQRLQEAHTLGKLTNHTLLVADEIQ